MQTVDFPRIVLGKEYRNQSQSLVEIMSATVCNVVEVMLRTPGDRVNATMKINRIVFTLQGDLNVNLFAINQSERIHQDQDSQDVLHSQQYLQ